MSQPFGSLLNVQGFPFLTVLLSDRRHVLRYAMRSGLVSNHRIRPLSLELFIVDDIENVSRWLSLLISRRLFLLYLRNAMESHIAFLPLILHVVHPIHEFIFFF